MSKRVTGLLTAVVALGLLAFYSGALKAADAPAAAANTITGKVVDDQGKAVADAKVNLAKPGGGGGATRPEPLATATTDKDGKFTLTFDTAKVPDGDYNLSCRANQMGARAKVTIKDGKSDPADVTLTLKARNAPAPGN